MNGQEPPPPDVAGRGTPPPPASVEGVVAQAGDVELRGTYVAGHDLIVQAAQERGDDVPPFLVVDQEYLHQQARKPKMMYVARSPDWADVVHGSDPDVRFIERDQTADLCAAVREELLEPCRREADSQLHSLFVLGAPGSGKTTLVRRVAAVLVQQGECVVADFGVNTERVPAGQADAYVKALDQLARRGVPVLVLLDDPFFANSGWVELLQALSRPRHRRVSVLGASPDFLFDRFANALFGRRVVGRTFDVSKPSVAEREALALLHRREPTAYAASDEDLLVVAMEAAAGKSFREIIARIWMTLNGGVSVDPTTDHRHLPWPVVAFAIVCYFHRNYVLCPEALLREILARALLATPPSYLAQELQELVTMEGWHIFFAQSAPAGPDGRESEDGHLRLIGATHARVAREAWNHSPLRGFNVEKAIVDFSVDVPQAIPQIAELILAFQGSPVPGERRLANRFAVRWSNAVDQGAVETRSVCALVRHLKSSRAARLHFRPVIRKCLTAQDDQSWLAAWQLFHLASASQHPQERDFLLKVNLPWTLKIGDLSKGPRETIDIVTRLGGDVRNTVRERLLKSLHGELDWLPDAEHLAWLIGHLPDQEVVPLLGLVYGWLENDLLGEAEDGYARGARVVDALMRFLARTSALDEAGTSRLLGNVFDWLLASDHSHAWVLQYILTFVESRARTDDPLAVTVLAQLHELLLQRPESNESVWAGLLALVGRSPGLVEEGRRIVPETFEWLRGRPESNESVWAGLLALVGRSPAFVEEGRRIVPEMFEWLRDRPESNESVWTGLLILVGRSSELAAEARRIVPETFAWLRDRPGTNNGAWGGLIVALSSSLGIGPDERAEMLDALRRWSDRCTDPDSPAARGVRLLVLAETPGGSAAATAEEVVGQVEATERPELLVVYPLAHLVRRVGRPDLSARLVTWARRYGEERANDDSSSRLTAIASLPRLLDESDAGTA